MTRKSLFIVCVLVGALSVVTAASAKGPVQVCGARGCVEIGAEGAAAAPFVAVPVEAQRLPVQPLGVYYVIRFAEHGVLSYWVPSVGALRFVDANGQAVWVAVDADQSMRLQQATAGLAPKPAPSTPTFAAVDGQDVRSPRGYLRLFSLGTPVASAGASAGWFKLYLYSQPETPWSDGADSLWISRTGSFLRRDGQVVRIPAVVARRVRARQPLM